MTEYRAEFGSVGMVIILHIGTILLGEHTGQRPDREEDEAILPLLLRAFQPLTLLQEVQGVSGSHAFAAAERGLLRDPASEPAAAALVAAIEPLQAALTGAVRARLAAPNLVRECREVIAEGNRDFIKVYTAASGK